MSWDEVVQLGQAVEQAGANIISTHFTWHEAAVPTISTRVPRAAFTGVTGRLRRELGIPTITSNRINMPDVAEAVLAPGRRGPGVDGAADAGRRGLCHQGAGRARRRDQYLHRLQPGLPRPHLYRPRGELPGKPAGLPRDSARIHRTDSPRRIAVVGAGPAGLGYATVAAQRGHSVTLFDAAAEIGGQFNLARRIPGKEEFEETLRYYRRMIELHGIDLRSEHPGRRGAAAGGRLRPHRHRHRHRTACAAGGRYRSSQGHQLYRRHQGHAGPWAEKWRSWAPVASASTWPS